MDNPLAHLSPQAKKSLLIGGAIIGGVLVIHRFTGGSATTASGASGNSTVPYATDATGNMVPYYGNLSTYPGLSPVGSGYGTTPPDSTVTVPTDPTDPGTFSGPVVDTGTAINPLPSGRFGGNFFTRPGQPLPDPVPVSRGSGVIAGATPNQIPGGSPGAVVGVQCPERGTPLYGQVPGCPGYAAPVAGNPSVPGGR